ncbi:MAG: DctP family TRAP transporter solute-binding subunit [Anaerolineaceae bacterium]|nr:DctP family TRAP transporter solute-binding subunit [Anaerolineaceae bacterium]
MKLKKILAISLALAMVVALAACGQASVPATSAPAASSAPAAPAEQPAAPAEQPSEGDTYKIVIGHAGYLMEGGLHPYQQGVEKFSELVYERTNGRITTEIHDSGKLGTERELIEGVGLGTVDMAIVTSSPVTGFVPEFNIFEMPYIFTDSEHAFRVLDGDIGQELLAKLADSNIKGLAFAENGWRSFTNNRGPINSVSDLAGLKVRVMESPVHIATMEAFGAYPTVTSWGETYTALQQGVCDAQENMMVGMYSVRLHEVQKYLSMTNHFYTPSVMIMNLDLFNGMSEEDQEIVMQAAREAAAYEREQSAVQQEMCLNKMVEEGLIVNEVKDIDSFKDAAKAVYERFSQYQEWFDRIAAA